MSCERESGYNENYPWKDYKGDVMTDYQPTEQDRVLLDYAQTAQRQADPWVEFEYYATNIKKWLPCTQGCIHPGLSHVNYRRKPRTVTLSYQGREWELPVPTGSDRYFEEALIMRASDDHINQWLGALWEIANGEGGQ
jgi:hypothetical protein